MGYKIVYGPAEPSHEQGSQHRSRLRIMTALFLLLTCLSVRTLWPEGTTLLRTALLPGAPTPNETAFYHMMTSLRSGEPLGESITVFCRTVVENGTAP